MHSPPKYYSLANGLLLLITTFGKYFLKHTWGELWVKWPIIIECRFGCVYGWLFKWLRWLQRKTHGVPYKIQTQSVMCNVHITSYNQPGLICESVFSLVTAVISNALWPSHHLSPRKKLHSFQQSCTTHVHVSNFLWHCIRLCLTELFFLSLLNYCVEFAMSMKQCSLCLWKLSWNMFVNSYNKNNNCD